MTEPKTVPNQIDFENKNGFLLIDKHPGVSSFQSQRSIKRLIGKQKVGFAGTLDPAATGLLVVGIGYATRLLSFVETMTKEYEFDLILGMETDSYDMDGEVVCKKDCSLITREDIEKTLQKYLGEIDQVPPKYSAIKIKGKRACDRVRAGEKVELKSRKIHIYKIEVLQWMNPRIKIRLNCSKGTYIRSLARDVGNDLECGAVADQIRRTKVGNLDVADAQNPDEIDFSKLLAVTDVLENLPRIEIPLHQLGRFLQGQKLSPGKYFFQTPELSVDYCHPVLACHKNKPVAIAELKDQGHLHPKKVFPTR